MQQHKFLFLCFSIIFINTIHTMDRDLSSDSNEKIFLFNSQESGKEQIPLVKITDEVSIINDMNNQIASAAEQQAATTQELSRSAGHSHENSSKLEETLRDEIASELNSLAEVADDLKNTANRFRN